MADKKQLYIRSKEKWPQHNSEQPPLGKKHTKE